MAKRKGLFAITALGGLGLVWLVRHGSRQPAVVTDGGTALVTGASSGIGEAFARLLAAEGYDIVLVARRQERLAALAAELSAAHGVEAGFLACDLATDEGVSEVSEKLRALPAPAFLVNNAGMGLRGRFWEASLEVQRRMIRLHVDAPVALAHAVLPGMLARNQGAIINVASMAGFMALPWNNSYSTTKRYLIQHSEGLALELANTGVRAQALCPGLTHSEFHDRPEYTRLDKGRYPSLMWMQPEQVAAESLAALRQGGPVVFVPGKRYRVLTPLLRSEAVKALLALVLPRLSLVR